MARPDHRRLILETLQKQEQPISAQALFAQLRQQGQTIGLATVYRILSHLRQEGLLCCHGQPEGEILYSLAEHHYHYLTCIRCRRMIRLPACPWQEWEKTLKSPEPFQVLYHELQLFGLCHLCQGLPKEVGGSKTPLQ